MNKAETQKKLEALKKEFLAKEEALLDGLTAEDRAEIGHPLKSVMCLDKFNANGKVYTIRTTLTIERFEEFEQLQGEVGFGVDFLNLFKSMRKGYDYLNDGQPADAAVVMYNVMHGIKKHLDRRVNEVLMLCTLFICREGEDVTRYDEALCFDKINDWKREGITMDNFFSLAFNLVNGFIPVYNEISQATSTGIKEAIKEATSPKP